MKGSLTKTNYWKIDKEEHIQGLKYVFLEEYFREKGIPSLIFARTYRVLFDVSIVNDYNDFVKCFQYSITISSLSLKILRFSASSQAIFLLNTSVAYKNML